jgi:hypothetical protein
MDAESEYVEDLKAEIERLKGKMEKAGMIIAECGIDSLKQKKLITELCDVLEIRLPFARVGVEAIDAEFDLVQRAREATR